MTESKEAYTGEFRGRKGKGRWRNYIIISKLKETILKKKGPQEKQASKKERKRAWETQQSNRRETFKRRKKREKPWQAKGRGEKESKKEKKAWEGGKEGADRGASYRAGKGELCSNLRQRLPSIATRMAVCPFISWSVMVSLISLEMVKPLRFIHSRFPISTEKVCGPESIQKENGYSWKGQLHSEGSKTQT